MIWGMILPLTVPFLATSLGSGAVLGLPVERPEVQRRLSGFAGGGMLGAVVWNLLVPGREHGVWMLLLGLALGLGLLCLADALGEKRGLWHNPDGMLMVAVVLHNIPEGLAVGLTEPGQAATMIGIALQNIPDGAVVSVPLAAMGMKKRKAFWYGVLSGGVEPLAALAAWALRRQSGTVYGMLMGFAAGAMLYVIIRELIPRMGQDGRPLWWFFLGFGVMLGLDGVT